MNLLDGADTEEHVERTFPAGRAILASMSRSSLEHVSTMCFRNVARGEVRGASPERPKLRVAVMARRRSRA